MVDDFRRTVAVGGRFSTDGRQSVVDFSADGRRWVADGRWLEVAHNTAGKGSFPAYVLLYLTATDLPLDHLLSHLTAYSQSKPPQRDAVYHRSGQDRVWSILVHRGRLVGSKQQFVGSGWTL